MSKTKIDPKKPLSLAQFATSDAGERFNLALEEALANALDPNRPIKSVRAVMLTVSIVPIQPKNDAQLVPNSANMTVGVSVKLAGLKSLAMPVHFGRKEGTGEPVAVGAWRSEAVLRIAAALKYKLPEGTHFIA